jgi:hypothetical protein
MKDNQCEQLFTDLTPETTAVVEGGASFGGLFLAFLVN